MLVSPRRLASLFLIAYMLRVYSCYFYHMMFLCFHMLRVLRSPSLNVIQPSSSFNCLFVEASASLPLFLSGWLRSCFPYPFSVLEVFSFCNDRRNRVYNVAALPLGGACQSIQFDPSLCTQSFVPYTRCRWPQLGLTYVYPE
jgi:hypothetical protein